MKSYPTYLKGNFKGLQHLGIPVSNLSVSVAFYTSLGFSRVLDSFVDVPDENDTIQVAMMEQNEVIIELYQVTKRDLDALRARKDGHVDHIAFDVEDVESAFHELKHASFKIIENEPVFLNFWERGCKFFAIRGPDGEKLEFNQIL